MSRKKVQKEWDMFDEDRPKDEFALMLAADFLGKFLEASHGEAIGESFIIRDRPMTAVGQRIAYRGDGFVFSGFLTRGRVKAFFLP